MISVGVATLIVSCLILILQLVRTVLQWRQNKISEKQLKHTKEGDA